LRYDPTNPKAREHVWKLVKQNYYDKGVRIFWLDVAEPEYNDAAYDFDNYRYHLGPNLQVGNIYPLKYAQGFYEGMRPRSRRILSILPGVRGPAANDTERSSGRATSIRALNRSAFSSLRALAWGSPEFPGGLPISGDSTGV
jgi:Glycosyl hydrolases family 31 TIM-barrel domain